MDRNEIIRLRKESNGIIAQMASAFADERKMLIEKLDYINGRLLREEDFFLNDESFFDEDDPFAGAREASYALNELYRDIDHGDYDEDEAGVC